MQDFDRQSESQKSHWWTVPKFVSTDEDGVDMVSSLAGCCAFIAVHTDPGRTMDAELELLTEAMTALGEARAAALRAGRPLGQVGLKDARGAGEGVDHGA